MRPAFLDNMSWAMAEVYAAVTDRIMINLARYFPYVKPGEKLPGSFEYQARMLAQMGQVNRETADIIMKSLDGADAALRGALETAILDALKNEEPKLRKAAEQGLLHGAGFLPPEVDAGQMQAFQSFYRQSADKLNIVNTVMLESTQAAYTATVSDVVNRIQRTQSIMNAAAGEVVTGVSSWNTAMHDAVQKMVDNGLTGFVDHGGHRWSPEAYVAMDVRTTMFNTARAAVAERAEQYGADLYQVSSHNGARPLCYPWQGKVISRSDWTGEVEDLDGNKVQVYAQSETSYGEPAGLFGINCKHYPMTFIPGFSTLKGEPQDPEENEKTYAESQQQRALERKLREEKRDLEVMKAQGADPEAIKAQRAKVKQASADIDQFCDETGRARRKNREYTPINAEFPEARKQTQVLTTKEDYDAEIDRLRTRRTELLNSESYNKAETDKLLADIFELEDKRTEIVAKIRPENEQEVLKQFKRYDINSKTAAQKLAQANPHFSEGGRAWRNNCQRTVIAEELIYRGYDVTAKAYNPNDALKDSGIKGWKFATGQSWWKDKDVHIAGKRSEFKQLIQDSFNEWGDGARAIVRVRWTKQYGGNGHFFNAIREGNTIKYVDPQSNTIRDIDETISRCTTGKAQLWLMRVDNRELSDLVGLAVENVGE